MKLEEFAAQASRPKLPELIGTLWPTVQDAYLNGMSATVIHRWLREDRGIEGLPPIEPFRKQLNRLVGR